MTKIAPVLLFGVSLASCVTAANTPPGASNGYAEARGYCLSHNKTTQAANACLARVDDAFSVNPAQLAAQAAETQQAAAQQAAAIADFGNRLQRA